MKSSPTSARWRSFNNRPSPHRKEIRRYGAPRELPNRSHRFTAPTRCRTPTAENPSPSGPEPPQTTFRECRANTPLPRRKRQRRQRCALLVALRICRTHNSRHPIQITSGTTPRHRTCRAPSDDKYLSGHAANTCAVCHAVIIKIAGGRQSPLPAFQNHAVNRQAARPHNAPSPQSVRRIRRDPTEGTNTPPGHRNASERDNGRPFPTACNDRRFPGTTHA